MTKEDKQIHKILLGIMVFLGLWLMASCTTMRNAERRHDRIVKNFPSVHKVDTVTIEKVVEIVTPPKIIQGETIFEKCPESGESLKGNDNGTKSLNTKVTIPEKKESVKVTAKIPCVQNPCIVEWWQNGWAVVFFLIVAVCLGWWMGSRMGYK